MDLRRGDQSDWNRRGGRTASVVLSAVGLGISIYLSAVHVTNQGVPLLCSATAAINCEQVTTSPESHVGPIPVAYLGVVWFVVAFTLSFAGGSSHGSIAGRGQLIWTSIGTALALYLIYAELNLIGSICLWCTVVHVLVFALFVLAVAATDAGPVVHRDSEEDEAPV